MESHQRFESFSNIKMTTSAPEFENSEEIKEKPWDEVTKLVTHATLTVFIDFFKSNSFYLSFRIISMQHSWLKMHVTFEI